MCHLNDEMTNLKEHNQKLLQNENDFPFDVWTKAQCHIGDKEEKKSSLQEQHQQICWQKQSCQF